MSRQPCENRLCIYWLDGTCTLRRIRLDEQGRCTNCIYVDVEESVLRAERKRLLSVYRRDAH